MDEREREGVRTKTGPTTGEPNIGRQHRHENHTRRARLTGDCTESDTVVCLEVRRLVHIVLLNYYYLTRSISRAPDRGQGIMAEAGQKRKKLTEKQQLVLDFVRLYALENGYGPSRPEIAHALGVTHVTTIGHHLQAIEKKGWIELRHDTPRAIRIIQANRIPVVEVTGRLSAEEPLVAPQRTVEYMPELLAQCMAPSADYCFRIGENDMKGPGFTSGDLVAIQANDSPTAGQAIVVRVDGEVICRVLRHKDEQFVELATIGTNGKTEGSVRIKLADHEVKFEGVVVRMLMALDLDEYNFEE